MFDRLDTTDDALFYSTPRFVEHVDEKAVQSMTDYISNEALACSVNVDDVPGGLDVLDVGSSWTSHVSPSVVMTTTTSTQQHRRLRRLVGIGMNQEELQANPLLTERIVLDLNRRPSPSAATTTTTTTNILPFEDNTFDVVLCQLSIDYLTRPLEVLRDIGRVLKPGGTIHILFSNRLFLTKAVGLWTGADDLDHVYYVACYLHFCDWDNNNKDDNSNHNNAPLKKTTTNKSSLFGNIRAKDLSTRTKGRDSRIVGDPLYVVVAEKMAL